MEKIHLLKTHNNNWAKENFIFKIIYSNHSLSHPILHTVPVEEGLWLFFIGF